MSRLTALNNLDFLIVGAGVIGLSTAWQLARTGVSVQVIDCGQAGRESSWAGGGMLFMLRPWDYPETVTALTELGRRLYPQWTAELSAASGIDPEYRQTGLLALPPMNFERAQKWCAAHNLQADLLPESDVSPLITRHRQALWLPQAAQVRNPRLLRSLTEALRSRGVTISENARVDQICVDRHRATGVVTANGVLSAGTVIVCAGAWSPALLGTYAAGADIFPVRGQMLLYKTPPGTLDSMIVQNDRYLIPRADGHILAGSTQEQVGFEKGTTREIASELHDSATAMLPCLANLQPIGHWAGLRPGSPNNIPVIAQHPNIENLYLNSGHFRYGLTMAPAAAQLLADLIDGRPPALDATPYAWPEIDEDRQSIEENLR